MHLHSVVHVTGGWGKILHYGIAQKMQDVGEICMCIKFGGVDVKCMYTNFGGHGLSGIGVMAPFCLPSKTAKISLQTLDYSPWSSKKLIDLNRLKKFMQIGVDVTHMHTIFGGCGFSDIRVMAPFCLPSKRPNFPFAPWTIIHGQQKILLIGIGSKNSCK